MLCLNVLERLENPVGALETLRRTLKRNGALVILVPNAPGLYGTLDRSLGHTRRYNAAMARRLVESAGFEVESIGSFNRVAALPWWAYSRMIGARNISKPVLKVFDKSVWFWRRLDALMPWPGLSLLVVARQSSGAVPDAEEREAVGDSTARHGN